MKENNKRIWISGSDLDYISGNLPLIMPPRTIPAYVYVSHPPDETFQLQSYQQERSVLRC